MSAARVPRQAVQAASSSPSQSEKSPTENPWKQPAQVVPIKLQQVQQSASSVPAVSLNDIISDEIQQKKALVKLTNKPLHLIQVKITLLYI